MGEHYPDYGRRIEKAHLAFVSAMLIGYVVFLPVQFRVAMGIRLAVSDIFLFFAILPAFFKIKFIKQTWSIWHVSLVYVFLLGLLIATFRTGQITSYAILNKTLGLFNLFYVYTIITNLANSWEFIRKIIKVFIVSVVVQNIFAIAAFIVATKVGFTFSWINFGTAQATTRLSGMLVDPNAYGGILVTAFSVHALTHFSKKPLMGRFWGWLSFTILTVGIVLTFSRSAWIGMAFVFLAVVISKPKLFFKMITLAAVVPVMLALMFGPEFFDLFLKMATRQNQIDARMDLINVGIDLFYDHPTLGIGLGVYYDQFGQIIHNTPIWFLVELGLVGFSVFVGFIMWFCVKGISAYKLSSAEQKPLILGLLSAHMAILGLSLGIEAFYQRHWWLIMALIASSYRIALGRPSADLDRSSG